MTWCSNADELLFAALNECFTHGQGSAARGLSNIEVLSWSAVLENPRARLVKNPARDVRKGYCAASVAWNLDRRDDVESIVWWNPGGRYISDNGKTFHGANYGQRWDFYLQEAIELLKLDPDTRRAWVPIWTPDDLTIIDLQPMGRQLLNYSRWGKDVPCTLGFGLRINKRGIDQCLDMQVVMRSQNTMVLPYDVFLFAVLQELIANELDIKLGRLHWHANSLHVYERREYAMNRSTYEWYLANLSSAKGGNYRWHRATQEPMKPITKTLTSATELWPNVLDQAMEGREACEALKDDLDLDPVESLIVEDAIRKHTETKVSAT